MRRRRKGFGRTTSSRTYCRPCPLPEHGAGTGDRNCCGGVLELQALLARARHLELKTRFLARSHYGGLFKSAFRGQGMEFSEVREYSPGDDIRLIDWNVSARAPSLYVKRMEEERERNVLILMDASGSLRFGTVRLRKFDLLVELGSLLAVSAYYAKDRVSLAVFRAKVDHYFPAAKGWNHAARLIREMVARAPEGNSPGIEPVWAFLNSPGIPRSLVVLLTDFMVPVTASNALAAACRKHEIIAILVSDPRESELPRIGWIRVQDPESGEGKVVNTDSPQVRERLRQTAAVRRNELTAVLHGSGIAWLELSTGCPYEGALRRFLEQRSARR